MSDEGALDLIVIVAPFVGVASVAGPFVGDADAADEADAAVDDEELAVGAVVDFEGGGDVVPVDFVIADDLYAGGFDLV